MKPLISVIVPVYNVSKYIEQCLQSLLMQTIKEIQIIIVDDCGTDDSIEKAKRMANKDKRIRIIHNKTNQGLAESRNIGLKYVQAKYVAFLDSDDWVEKDFYEKLYEACKKENADIAVSDVVYYYSDSKQTREWVSIWNFKSGKKIVYSPKEKQYNIYACAIWNKLYKTELFTDHKLYFPKGLYYEDVPITFITTVLANKIILVEDAKLYYRMRGDSIMSLSKTDRRPFDIFKIYEYAESLLDKYKKDDAFQYIQILDNFKIFNTYSWYNGINPLFKNDFYRQMRKVFVKIDIKHNPFITAESKKIYKDVCHSGKSGYTVYIRLLGFIPFLKYRRKNASKSLYLFGILPLYKYKCSNK